jgi:hypothetical protein
MVDHFNDLSQDLVASVIKFGEDLLLKIAVSKSNLDVDLGLGGFSLRVTKPRHKGSLISPLSPGLCQIRAHRTRGSPDLIRQREPFLDWKMLSQFENTHYQRHSSLIDVQFPKMFSGSHNIIFERITLSPSEAPLGRDVLAYWRVGVSAYRRLREAAFCSLIDVQFPKMHNENHNIFSECTIQFLRGVPLPF